MIITGHQPNYLPYPGFFHKIIRADAFVIVDTTQFVKRGPFGWIHRNRVRTPSGEGWEWLTVPVLTKGKFHQAINETLINDIDSWNRKHLRTIEYHYHKAPYFEKYFPIFEEIYGKKWEKLADLTEYIIRLILSELNYTKPIYKTSELETEGKAAGLIVDFCSKLGADAYLSGIHGRDYLEEGDVEKAGIKLVFQEYTPRKYPQQYQGFIPDLSILDMLMNIGPADTLEILED